MSNYTNTEEQPLNDRQWDAVIHNDCNYDGQFFYAVRTTKIFCRPACRSRPPKRENVIVFLSAEQALNAGYRPCKRCKPTGKRVPDEEWVSTISSYIATHYLEPLTLVKLAALFHGSPFHLHRTFLRLQGLTPNQYLQEVRISHACRLLEETSSSVTEIGRLVGLSNTPYFITLFKRKMDVTPERYRRMHQSAPPHPRSINP